MNTRVISSRFIGQIKLEDSWPLKITFLALIILILGAHLITLTTYPPVFVDESWNSNSAWTWLRTGNHFDSIHTGPLDQYGYQWVRRPLLGDLPWVVIFAQFGLGLFQARFVSWIFGCLLLLVVGRIGWRLYGSLTGLTSALFLSLSPVFIQASHWARPDILLATVILLAFLFAIIAFQSGNLWSHFLVGLLAGISLDIHQNGLLFIPGFIAIYLLKFNKKIFQKGSLFAVLGGAIGILFYLVVHYFPNPDVFWKLFSFSFSGPHISPFGNLNPIDVLKSIRGEVGRYHFYENNLDFALIGASITYLLARRSASDKILSLFVGVTFISFVFISGKKVDHYAILLYPLFMLIVSEAILSQLARGNNLLPTRIFFLVIMILFLLNSIIHFSRPVNDAKNYDYYRVTKNMNSVIPSSAKVMGSPLWWLGFSDHDYISTFNFSFYKHFNNYSVYNVIELESPDFLIVDEILRGQMYALPESDPYFLSGEEFENLLNNFGEMVLEFDDPYHGSIEIYKITNRIQREN